MKRIVVINLIVIAVIFALADVYVDRGRDDAEGPSARLEFDPPVDYHVRDEDLGYRGAADQRIAVRFYFDDRKIFDVTYTTDSLGLRVAPDSRAAGVNDPCVLFFGGSYTFGAGVDDAETTANVVGRDGGRAVRNFGFSGYGPHQMLAALESGFVARAAPCEATHAIYLAQAHHVLRAAGKFRADRYGPRFVLRDGLVVRDGNFHDNPVADFFYDAFEMSSIATRLRERRRATDDDAELFHAIVARSAALLRERHADLEFHVLFWNNGERDLFVDARDRTNIEVHPLSDVLPLRHRERLEADYQIPFDGHPNARAHATLAAYVIDEVLGGR